MGRFVNKLNSSLVMSALLISWFVGITIISVPANFARHSDVASSFSSFSPHSPITITSDASFAAQGWPGEGSAESPYIIEDLVIATSGTCITIANTNAHFIIRNCTLLSTVTGTGYGVYFSHVNNGAVENCSISLFHMGIWQSMSNNCSLVNNTLAACDYIGIYVYAGNNCTLNYNKVNDCESYGLYIYVIEFSTIAQNHISNSGQMGIVLLSSQNIICASNTITDSSRFGLYLSSCANLTLANNVLENGGFGIAGDMQYWIHDFSGNSVNGKPFGYFLKANDIEINGSLFGQVFLINCTKASINSGLFFNASIGLNLLYCTNCTISNAELKDNLYGINLLESENTTLEYNTLIHCGVRIDGFEVKYWNISQTGNTVNGKQFGYFLSQDNLAINGDDYGQLILVDSNSLSIENGTFDSVTVGVIFYSCFNCSAKDIHCVENYYIGIRLIYSPNCTLTNVTSEGCHNGGIYITSSDNATLIESRIHDNGEGIILTSSSYYLIDSNQVYDNTGNSIDISQTFYGVVSNNMMRNNSDPLNLYIVNYLQIINNTITGSSSDGIYLDFTSGVKILDNRIYGNIGYGINVRSYALQSKIYNNMIGFNRAGNALDYGIFNNWDDGVGIGNIWSDYSGTGTYSVSGVGVDHYPLGFVSRPADVHYIVGSSVPPVTWYVRLPNPGSYSILWQGVTIAQNILNTSLEYLSKAIGGLAIGTYNLTLVVTDKSGYGLVDTVIITVTEQSTTTTTTTTTTTSTTTTTTVTTSTTATTASSFLPEGLLIPVAMVIGTIGGVVVLVLVIIWKRRVE
jgi:parallel beta-helix repeat protein